MVKEMRSGQVATAAGVNLQTLRYYERRGLLEPPARTIGGHRLYSTDVVAHLKAIKTAQRLGFTLTEVGDLLKTGAHRPGKPADPGLQARAAAKLAEVEKKIADLQMMRDMLQEAANAGCDDLVVCADSPQCPLPFDGLVARSS